MVGFVQDLFIILAAGLIFGVASKRIGLSMVVGYLLACPLKTADRALDRLRRTDPKGVAKAEHYHQKLRALSQ